jgi:hypothetical protein
MGTADVGSAPRAPSREEFAFDLPDRRPVGRSAQLPSFGLVDPDVTRSGAFACVLLGHRSGDGFSRYCDLDAVTRSDDNEG